jgi:hypothetical protein
LKVKKQKPGANQQLSEDIFLTGFTGSSRFIIHLKMKWGHPFIPGLKVVHRVGAGVATKEGIPVRI